MTYLAPTFLSKMEPNAQFCSTKQKAHICARNRVFLLRIEEKVLISAEQSTFTKTHISAVLRAFMCATLI